MTNQLPDCIKITVSEGKTEILIQDLNENSILMSADGIKIISCKDLVVEAPGDMTLRVKGDVKETIGGKLTTQSKGDISTTSKAKIKRDATGNIEDSSQADIKLKATADVDIRATADAKMAGLNVNHSANAQFVAKGNAGAELSTSAIAILKGELVRIN